MKYWLMKSEPDECSIDHVLAAPGRITPWSGVRNYQARNFMRDQMKVGDGVLFYHSSCPEPGIAGVAEVASVAYTDKTQFDKKSEYFDPGSTRESPRWFVVDVQLKRRLKRIITLDELRKHADDELDGMLLLKRGNRLSITPVSAAHWKFILTLE